METTTIYEYAWADLLKYTDDDGTHNTADPYNIYARNTNYCGWNAMLAAYGASTTTGISSLTNIGIDLQSNTIKQLMAFYVFPRIWHLTGLRTESELGEFTADASQPYINAENSNKDAVALVRRVAAYLASTYKYYSKIISLYEAQSENLLNQVSSTVGSVDKYNDMPQTADITTENHLTNIGSHDETNKTDMTTPIERLAEIRDKLDNTYKRWADEFVALFCII
jgi:hypothetical protein